MATPDGPPHDLVRLVAALDRHGVAYLLVGGAAAHAYGAERMTDDADCVVRRDRANLDRLAEAMRELHARLHVAGMSDEEARQLPVRIDAQALESLGISTWMTDAGGFDVLAGLEAADGRLVPFEELSERATVLRGDGFVVRAAALEDIITAKERAGRPKDLEALPELRALRDGGDVGGRGGGPVEGLSGGPGAWRRQGSEVVGRVVEAVYPQGMVPGSGPAATPAAGGVAEGPGPEFGG